MGARRLSAAAPPMKAPTDAEGARAQFRCVPLRGTMTGVTCAKRWRQANGTWAERRGGVPIVGCDGCDHGKVRYDLLKEHAPDLLKRQRVRVNKKAAAEASAAQVAELAELRARVAELETLDRASGTNSQALETLADALKAELESSNARLDAARRQSESRRKMLAQARSARDEWKAKATSRRVELRQARRRAEAAEVSGAREVSPDEGQLLFVENERLRRELGRIKEAVQGIQHAAGRARTILDEELDQRRGEG